MMRIALGRRADGESVTSIAKRLTYKTASGEERTVSRRVLYNSFKAHDAERAERVGPEQRVHFFKIGHGHGTFVPYSGWGVGQTVGALLAFAGATAVYAVPGVNEPVMASTVSAPASVASSEPLAEVAQAVSSTGLEIFRTWRFWPLAPEKISSWSPWEFSMKSLANFGEFDGTTPLSPGP